MPSIGRNLNASPADAWELIVSTRTWPEWGPSVAAVRPPDTAIRLGMRGQIRTPVGLWLPFRVTHFQPPHSWSWSVLGLPATSHHVEQTESGCRVSFAVPFPAAAYLLVCRLALARIASLLEGPTDRIEPRLR